MEKLIQNYSHRCHNKAASLNDPYNITYIVGQGEDRWHCQLPESDARELRKNDLELDRWIIKCPTLDDCKAYYTLREIRKVEPMQVDPYDPTEQLREIPKAEPMDVDPSPGYPNGPLQWCEDIARQPRYEHRLLNLVFHRCLQGNGVNANVVNFLGYLVDQANRLALHDQQLAV